MKLKIEESFKRDLKKIKDRSLLKEIKSLISEIYRYFP